NCMHNKSAANPGKTWVAVKYNSFDSKVTPEYLILNVSYIGHTKLLIRYNLFILTNENQQLIMGKSFENSIAIIAYYVATFKPSWRLRFEESKKQYEVDRLAGIFDKWRAIVYICRFRFD